MVLEMSYSKRVVAAMEKPVAVITGANAGIGLSVADRLLSDHESIHVCLACRNEGRAEWARKRLLRRHPNSDISIIIVDTSSMESVFRAAEEIRVRFSRLDYLFLNAGIMKVSAVNWTHLLGLLTSKSARILSTGEGCLKHEDGVTADGLQQVFATNLFGHFVLVRELEDHITGDGGGIPTQVIWTSSQNAAQSLDLTDIQHRNGTEPYSASKYATDVLSVAMNDRLNKKGIYSVSTCPGLVMSNMTFGILPPWVWMLVMPFFIFMRLFVSNITHNAFSGAEALVWTTKQKPASLNPRSKYSSCRSFLGRRYVQEGPMNIKDSDADGLYEQLEELYQGFRQKYGDTNKAPPRLSNGVSNGHTDT